MTPKQITRTWGITLLLIVGCGLVAYAVEDVDQDIVKDLEFYSQFDVIQNLDIAVKVAAVNESQEQR